MTNYKIDIVSDTVCPWYRSKTMAMSLAMLR